MRAHGVCLLPFLLAALPAQDPLPERDFAVRCGRLHVGDGRVLQDVWLVVRGGKVRSVGAEEPPPGLPVLDAKSRVVMPGIVAADTDLSPARDEEYAVTPDVLAADGFDFVAQRSEPLSGGVTTAYLSPGRQRLVSGQGAVVKLHGNDLERRVLRESACLRVNVGEGATAAPRVFEPTVFPTADDPLLPARMQRPTARISLLAELRQLLRAGGQNAGQPGSPGPEQRYEGGALQAAGSGELPLRASAQRAQDIARALQLGSELGIGAKLVLEDPWEIEPVAARAAAMGAAATFRVPVTANAAAPPGGEDRRQDKVAPSLEAPARAAAAGMRVALSAPARVSMRDWLWAVAHAVRGGMSQTAAMRAICADAAAILGVLDRVGTLEPDKDADFVILTGDPFAVGTLVEATYVEGAPAFQRKDRSRLLAVRAGRVLTGDGRSLAPGTILCENGRIVGIGEGLSAPYGATVIDLADGVMTPGFIDAVSHLGLAGDGTAVPPGAANQRVADAVAHDDPMFRPALEAGITTVLVAGKDGGPISGRVAAVKTGARTHEAMVLRETAGLRFLHDAIGPEAGKPLEEAIDRGRKYLEAWQKYEQALADFKAGKGKKPEAAPAPAPEEATPDPLSGTWEATIDVQGRVQLRVVLDLKLEGTKVTGQVRVSFGQRELPGQDVQEGSFEGGRLKLSFSGMGGTATLEATVEGDNMTGQISIGPMGSQEFRASRTSGAGAGASATPAAASGEPRKPAVDENLEPLRAIVEKKAAAIVKVGRAGAIKDVVAVFEKAGLPYLLHGAEGLLDDPSALGDKRPGVVLGPEVVRDEPGRGITNLAARMCDLGLPVALGSGECQGASNLPMHAAYAVRYGLSPDDALAAVTSAPAKLFLLQDRIGTLQKGKDADFVVFSGNPFEPTSRVLLVVVDGEVVVDHRSGGAR